MTLVGVAVNFGPQLPQVFYQLMMTGLLTALKENLLPLEVSKYLFLESFTIAAAKAIVVPIIAPISV